MSIDFAKLLAHVEHGELSLSTIPARISTGPLLSATDEFNLAEGVAADGDFPALDSIAPMLVVLTDRRLLVGHAKRTSRCKIDLRRVLGEIPLDRIEGIEPRRIDKVGRRVWPYVLLALVSMALLFVLFDLEHTLPSPVWWGLIIAVGLVGQGAAYGTVRGDHVESLVVDVNLSSGKSIPFELHRNPDSFLSAFRTVSEHR